MPSTVLGAGDNVRELNRRPKCLLCDAYTCLNSPGGWAHQGNRGQMVRCTSEHQLRGDGACTEHRWEASQQSGVSSEGHVQADGATTGKTVMWEHEWSTQRMLRKPEGQERGAAETGKR